MSLNLKNKKIPDTFFSKREERSGIFLLHLRFTKICTCPEKQRKSIRETCPHFQYGTRQSLVFGWVHEISVLAQVCASKKRALAQVCDTISESLAQVCARKKMELEIEFVNFFQKKLRGKMIF